LAEARLVRPSRPSVGRDAPDAAGRAAKAFQTGSTRVTFGARVATVRRRSATETPKTQAFAARSGLFQ
jgi:hypothetical protein